MPPLDPRGSGDAAPDAVDPSGLDLLTELAQRSGIALDGARLLAAEHEARRHAEQARDRTRRLQRLTAALSGAIEEHQVVSIMVDAGRDALGAAAGFAWLLRNADTLELAGSEHGGRPGRLDAFRRIAMTDRVPVCDVVRGGQPMMFENLAAMAAGYPAAIPPGDSPFRAWAVIPFVVAGRGAGAVSFSFADERAFREDDRELLAAMAGQASLALERARLYEALQRTADQLRIANRRKDEFLAMLGHELRNPLAPIATALDLMELKDADALHREREVIHRQVDHLSRLIDDLLDVSRITRGKIELNRQVVELGAVLAKAIEMASPLLEKRSQRLAIDVPRAGLAVDADPVRLAQVFHNLLTNAAKYSDPAVADRSCARGRAAERIVVELADPGIGISPELLPRLFEPVRPGRARARSRAGWARPRPRDRAQPVRAARRLDRGDQRRPRPRQHVQRDAAVRWRRPRRRPAERAGEPMAPSSPGMRVLVVDDNVDAAQMLHEVLARLGHQAAIAHDGAGGARRSPVRSSPTSPCSTSGCR